MAKYFSNYNIEDKTIECGDKCVISNKLYVRNKNKNNEIILEETIKNKLNLFYPWRNNKKFKMWKIFNFNF